VTGQSGPQNVTGGVLVSVSLERARPATKQRLCDTVLPGCVPTSLAAVRGVPGIHVDHHASSVFRFGTQDRHEQSPARITDTSIQPGLSRSPIRQEPPRGIRICHGFCAAQHIADIQILDGNEVIYLHQRPRSLVVEVATLVGDLTMPSHDSRPGPVTIFGTALLSRKSLLRDGESRRAGARPAGIVHMLTLRGSHENRDPHVDSHWVSGGGQRVRRDLVTRQDQIPVPALAADLDRLHRTGDCAVRGDLHMSDTFQIDPRGVRMPPGPVTVFRPLHIEEPVRALESWIAGLRIGFDTTEESVERPVQPTQRCLLTGERPHLEIRADRPNAFELRALGPIGDASVAVPPPVPAFLQCRIVQLPMRIKATPQCHMLPTRRPHPELVRTPHTTTPHRCSIRRRRYFGNHTRCRKSELTPPAERRNRDPAMTKRYKPPPTCTAELWSGTAIPLRAEAANPLGAR